MTSPAPAACRGDPICGTSTGQVVSPLTYDEPSISNELVPFYISVSCPWIGFTFLNLRLRRIKLHTRYHAGLSNVVRWVAFTTFAAAHNARHTAYTRARKTSSLQACSTDMSRILMVFPLFHLPPVRIHTSQRFDSLARVGLPVTVQAPLLPHFMEKYHLFRDRGYRRGGFARSCNWRTSTSLGCS